MARVPLNPPPHLHAASAGPAVAPRTPCRPRLATNPAPADHAVTARSGATPVSALSRRSPGADPQGREPAGSWPSARPGSMELGAWQPATGNPGRGPDPPVRLHHRSLPLMSDGDQQGRRCLVQDAPSPSPTRVVPTGSTPRPLPSRQPVPSFDLAQRHGTTTTRRIMGLTARACALGLCIAALTGLAAAQKSITESVAVLPDCAVSDVGDSIPSLTPSSPTMCPDSLLRCPHPRVRLQCHGRRLSLPQQSLAILARCLRRRLVHRPRSPDHETSRQ